jgi:hypothetical protein
MSVFAVWISLMSTLFGAADDPECYALGGLDVARAEALADGNLTELRAVYAHSTATEPDAQLLKRYAARGLRVVGAGLVRGECRVVARAAARVELDVAEHLARAWAVGPTDESTRLPRDGISRHRIVLTGGAGRWRIASVR